MIADFTFAPDQLIADPYPTYARMRREAPVWWDDATDMWLVSRHRDVDRLLRDRSLGRVFVPYEPTDRFGPWNLLNEHALLELEPPDHTRLRRLVAQPFTPRRIAGMRERIGELAGALLAAIDPADFDLMSDFADRLPVEVIAELLGVPASQRAPLRPWSNQIVALYELDHDEATAEAAITAAADFTAMLDELIAWRRGAPGDDLLSALVQAEVDGDALTRDELIATAALLLNAGHEASVNVIGNGVVALARDPAQLALLREDPSLIATAVDELIRYDTPLSVFQRTVFSSVEVAGQQLDEGTRVGVLLGAANRDPDAFDQPDRLDVTRRPNPHVGFGGGIHYCLGAPLARLEVAVAIEQLLALGSSIELRAPPVRRRSFQFRGYSEVRLAVM